MNSQAMSLSDSPLYTYNLSPFDNQSSKRSNLEPSSFISFKNPSLSMKTSQKLSRRVTGINAQGGQTFYEVLGVSVSGTLCEIKKAYKQVARKYHPDVSPADRIEEHTQMFIRIQEAYKTLSDPHARASYDRNLCTTQSFVYAPRFGAVYGGVYYPWTDDESQWKKRWEAQIAELKRMSRENENKDRESWGARMRNQASE